MALEKVTAAVRRRGVLPVLLLVVALAASLVMLAIVPRPTARAPVLQAMGATPGTSPSETTQPPAVTPREISPTVAPSEVSPAPPPAAPPVAIDSPADRRRNRPASPAKPAAGSCGTQPATACKPAPVRWPDCSVEAVAPTLDTNLIRNASFEKGPSCWRLPDRAVWEATGGTEGSGALAIQAERPPDDPYIHETAVEQCVPIGASEQLVLKARVKLDGMPVDRYANKMEVLWYDTADCSAGGEWGDQIVAEVVSGWQDLAGKSLKPTLTARAALIRIIQNGRSSNRGKAYWDEIALSPTQMSDGSNAAADRDSTERAGAAGTSYVVNGDFGADVHGWHARGDFEWIANEGDSSPGAARVSARSRTSHVVEIEQCATLRGERSFELGGSFKRDAASTGEGGARLRMTWYETPDCHGRSRTSDSAIPKRGVDGWQRLKVTGLSPPARAHSARITIIQAVEGLGGFYAWWDDIYFRAVD